MIYRGQLLHFQMVIATMGFQQQQQQQQQQLPQRLMLLLQVNAMESYLKTENRLNICSANYTP